MPNIRRFFAASVFVLALGLPALASAQNGPAGKSNWLSIRGEALSTYQLSPRVATGLSVEWGMLQNQFFGVGTRIGFSNADGSPAFQLYGGPQAHIAVGENFTIMPSMVTGLRLSETSFGFYFGGALAAVMRFDTFYVGAEGELPLFIQGATGNRILPGFYSVNLVGGFYF